MAIVMPIGDAILKAKERFNRSEDVRIEVQITPTGDFTVKAPGFQEDGRTVNTDIVHPGPGNHVLVSNPAKPDQLMWQANFKD